MTVLTRAATLAALSLGIVGLAAVSAPGNATQAASDTIVGTGQAALQSFQLPATALTIEPPATVEAVASPASAPADDQDQTRLDAANTPEPSFQSLADAVASQAMPGDPGTELRCLAGAIYYEAKGEPLAGQLAVAEVIINRARSGRFPRSLCGVVTQPGQFSFVRGGAIPAVNPTLGQWRTAMAVAQVALGDAWESPASSAMFFHARYVTPSWSKPRVASIGNHVFYR